MLHNVFGENNSAWMEETEFGGWFGHFVCLAFPDVTAEKIKRFRVRLFSRAPSNKQISGL